MILLTAKYHQQVKRVDPCPLLCAGEAAPGICYFRSVKERPGIRERIQGKTVKIIKELEHLSCEKGLKKILHHGEEEEA